MRKPHFLCLAAACLLFAIIYSPFKLYFLSDDWDSIAVSQQAQSIFHSFRPLSDASLWIDFSFWKNKAWGFHLTNTALHFACVFCLYFFVQTMVAQQYNRRTAQNFSLIVSLLFLVYPFHSEAIFWIVGRGALLCTLFSLLSFLFFFREEGNRNLAIALLCFTAALFSYEEAWIVPVLLSVLSKTQTRNYKRFTKRILPFWILFAAYLIGRWYFTKSIIGTPYGSERFSDAGLLSMVKNSIVFLARSVLPPMQSAATFAVCFAVISVLFLFLFWKIRKKGNAFLLIMAGCFLLSLLPVLPLGIDTHDTESERFLYFPSLFFCVCITSLLFETPTGKKNLLIILLFIVSGITLQVSYRNFTTSSNITRTTVAAVHQSAPFDTLFCYDLPGQYKGAFIFRNGFENAIKFTTGDTAAVVQINSYSELFHPAQPYSMYLPEDAAQPNTFSQEVKTNLYIRWTEKGVEIRKKPF